MKTNYKKFGGVILAITTLSASFWGVATIAHDKAVKETSEQLDSYYGKIVDDKDKAYSKLSNDYSITLDNYEKDKELLNEAIETIETNRDTIETKNLEIRLLNTKLEYLENNPTIVEKVVTQTVEVPTYITQEVVKEVPQENNFEGYSISQEKDGSVYIQTDNLESNLTVTYNGSPEAEETPSTDTGGNWLLITDK